MSEVAGSIPVLCFLQFFGIAPRAGNKAGRGGNYTQAGRRLAWRGAQPSDLSIYLFIDPTVCNPEVMTGLYTIHKRFYSQGVTPAFVSPIGGYCACPLPDSSHIPMS